MGGGLPKPSGPTAPTQPPPSHQPPSFVIETVGLIVDAQTRQPVPNALVVITDAGGHPVGIDTTDAAGGFSLYLLDKPGLELAVPSEGLAGIDVQAGDSLLILVP